MKRKEKYVKPETSVLEPWLDAGLMELILSKGGPNNPIEAGSKRLVMDDWDDDDWDDDNWGDLWEE